MNSLSSGTTAQKNEGNVVKTTHWAECQFSGH